MKKGKINRTLLNFCEVKKRALELYSEKYRTKDVMYDLLEAEFGRSYRNVILIGIEAAAECWNFRNDIGPWMRDLKEKAGYFTSSELKLADSYA